MKGRLDQKLIDKLKEKTGYSKKYLHEQISKRAGRLGISSEAFLVIWAKKEGIGTALYQRKLPDSIQAEIRFALPFVFSQVKAKPQITVKDKIKIRSAKIDPLSAAIEYLIQDEELKDRCKDLIKASRNFDRVFREATTVLEDRLKKLSGEKRMRPIDLIGKVLNPDSEKAVLKVSSENFEQEGFFSICKGLVLSFRDTTHHELSDKFVREDALKFCGFVDSLLGILSKAVKQEVD